jgi:hypothetical protein
MDTQADCERACNADANCVGYSFECIHTCACQLHGPNMSDYSQYLSNVWTQAGDPTCDYTYGSGCCGPYCHNSNCVGATTVGGATGELWSTCVAVDATVNYWSNLSCPLGTHAQPGSRYCLPLQGTCQLTSLNGKYRVGNVYSPNYPDPTQISESSCRAACDAEPDCVGYDHTPDLVNGRTGQHQAYCRVYGANMGQHAQPPWSPLGSAGVPQDTTISGTQVSWSGNIATQPRCVAVAGRN